MNIYKIAEDLKKGRYAQAYALNPAKKEVFILDYDEDPDRFTDLAVFYSRSSGSMGEEDSFDIDEFLDEFEYGEELTFKPLAKKSFDALDYEYNYAVEILRKNELNK